MKAGSDSTTYSGVTSPEFRELLAFLRGRPFSPDQTSSAELRAKMDALAAAFYNPPPASYTPVDANGVDAEWIVADGVGHSEVLLYFHGGGYAIGSPATHRDLCARLSTDGEIAVLSVDYRLAPEHPFPAAVEDALAAYRWLLSDGIEPTRIVVGGDSAGGGLALSLLLAARDAGNPLPAGAICFSPLVDLAHEGESVRTRAADDPLVTPAGSHALAMQYVGSEDKLKDPLASPLYGDLKGLPPVFLQVGTAEVLLDDSLRLARRLREAESPVELDVWPSMIHIFPYFAAKVPESRRAILDATSFIRNRVRS